MNSNVIIQTYSLKRVDHWVPFWVGLMDGDGSFQVNRWRKKNLQFSCIIKLKHTPANIQMLTDLVSVLKVGRVCLDKKADQVLWVEDHRDKILQLITLMKMYPPLSSRVICQLAFVQEFIRKDSTPVAEKVTAFLDKRDLKYINQKDIIIGMSVQNVVCCSYFPSWLSGFIEAAGCFSVKNLKHQKKPQVFSFSISQKKDLYLLEALKIFIKAKNKTREVKSEFFVLEVYKRSVLEFLYMHFSEYPLLGEKKKSMVSFYEKFFVKSLNLFFIVSVVLSNGCES